MARCVDNIDTVIAMRDGSYLGSNSNTPFALLITTVHDERLLHLGLVIAKCLGLLEQTIDQGRLTVVNVGNNCNISNVLGILCHKNKRLRVYSRHLIRLQL